MVKSIVRTIRIDEDLNAAIEKLATENRTSVNFIVNSILRENVEWTSIVSKLGFGTYPHYLSITLFDMLTDMECEATGEKIAREFLKPLLEYRFGNVSFDSWVQLTKDFSKYTGQFQFLMEKRRDGQTMFILEHGSGIKTSHFFVGAGRYIYGESLGKNVRTEITDTKCTLWVS